MKTPQFNDLTLVDKAWLIYEYGDFLISIEYYDHRVQLYSLNNQFIELFQNIDTRQIDKIEVVTYNALDKYLSRILIQDYKRK